MAIAYLGIVLNFLSAVLEVMVYIAIIFVSFKGIKALNIYIDKNSF